MSSTGPAQNHVDLRPAQPGDLPAILHVHRSAFPSPAESRLVNLLVRNDKATVSLVAEEAGKIVGHVLFSPVALERRTSPSAIAAAEATGDDVRPPAGLGLAPAAVLPMFQRRGIGSRLIRAGLDRCRELSRTSEWGFIVVLGAPAYYGRFGFQPARQFELSSIYDAGDAFQVLELQPGVLAPFRGGRIHYAEEFASLEDEA